MIKKVAIYCRVSSNDQNVDSQLQAIKKHCMLKGWSIYRIFTDKGISGTQEERPELSKLKQECAGEDFQAVVVYKFDRMARSTSHLLECLQLFNSYGKDFISISESIDTSTSIGKMVFIFLGAIAEFERSLIKERVRTGINRAQSSGVHCGRPRKGFDVGTAIQMHNEGVGLRKIALKLNVSYGTIYRTLKSVTKTSFLDSKYQTVK